MTLITMNLIITLVMSSKDEMSLTNMESPLHTEQLIAVTEQVSVVTPPFAVIEDIPAAVEQVPAVEEQIPAVIEDTPADIEQVPAVEEQIPAVIEDTPADIEQVPAVEEQIPAVIEDTPADIEQVPAVEGQVTTVIEDTPADIEQVPAVEGQVTTVIEDTPADIEQVPAVEGQVTTVIRDTPADIENVTGVIEVPTVIEQLSADMEQKSDVTQPESGILAQISNVSQTQSANIDDTSQHVYPTAAPNLLSRDGAAYEWDSARRGWFPKINEDMIAAYTMSFGTCSETNDDNNIDKSSPCETDRKRLERDETEMSINKSVKKVKDDTPTWFKVEESQNKHVYVSNLPSNITEQEFIHLMRKCGVIAEHDDGKPRVKLYRTEEGELKGDALCTYLKVESVPYAELILDGYDMDGHKLKVQPAHFEMKGQYNASLKPKKKNKNKKNRAEKLVKWKDPYYDRPRNERVVILKNVFTPEEMAVNPLLSEQVRDQIKGECEKFGQVKKAIVSERCEEGVVSVMFVEHSGADKCVQIMNGRTFGGRVMECSLWDGETSFVAEETEEETSSRLELWEEYLKK